jgi:hypothetical protein
MTALENYFRSLSEIHNTGSATKETSYYGPLETLLNELGQQLKPKVRCVMQLRQQGAGMPDGGLFSARQFQRSGDLKDPTNPERGVIEVKGTGEEVSTIAQSQQVSKYWQRYGQVLVTNYRDFVLVGRDTLGQPVTLESFSLAASEPIFWQKAQDAKAFAKEQEEQLTEYLKRVMLHQAVITSPQDLAWFLASYAKDARARIDKTDLPNLNQVREALEEALGVGFQGEKGDRFFKSTLIQTLFYGIFSAWVLWHRQGGQGHFRWREAVWYMHVPMIQALFSKVATPMNLGRLDLVEVLDWAGEALNRVDRASFFTKFEEAQAVQYFYEPFLQAFDPQLRKDLGVWYTPPEIVQYMVARVDTVLREELGIADGLADPKVYILDPCCGTGAFLVEVLRKIDETLKANGADALGGSDLKQAAMERVFGFEILTAPFVVAHLQLGLLLQNLGVPLTDDQERVGVFLTNALTGWEPATEEKQTFLIPELEEERDAAERVKQKTRILVILGNPPYNSFAGMAVGEERDLSDAYRTTKRAPKPEGQGLNDLYTRFFRMAERRIVDQTGKGVVCFISNYSYLDGLSFTGMRERYLEVFDQIWIDCLNGDKFATGKLTPEGAPDPSIFSTEWNKEGIQVGTAIGLLLRQEDHQETAEIKFRQLWGTTKRQQLLEDSSRQIKESYEAVDPPLVIGLPFKPLKFDDRYSSYPVLPEIFPVFFSGVQTKRDEFVVDIDKEVLLNRLKKYFDASVSDEEMRQINDRSMEDTNRFKSKEVRKYLIKRGFLPEYVVRYCYRPFDLRWIYWEPETKLLGEKSPSYFPQIFEENLWIEARQKQPKETFDRGYFTKVLADNLGNGFSSYFPLYLKEKPTLFNQGADLDKPVPNLSGPALQYLTSVEADEKAIFYHTLAILHCPTYREANAGALKQDWPRIPLPKTRELLINSANLGKQIAALLDTETPVPGVTSGKLRDELKLIAPITRLGGGQLNPDTDLALTANWGYGGSGGITMPGKGRIVTRPYTPTEPQNDLLGTDTRDIYLNDIAYWQNIPARVWDYTIGGYQVIKKWLSYREAPLLGRPLKPDEVREVTNMARRIAAILLLEPDLNANYEVVKANTYNWPSSNP